MINQSKYLFDSLNIVVFLATGCEFSSAKYAKFHLTFTE